MSSIKNINDVNNEWLLKLQSCAVSSLSSLLIEKLWCSDYLKLPSYKHETHENNVCMVWNYAIFVLNSCVYTRCV